MNIYIYIYTHHFSRDATEKAIKEKRTPAKSFKQCLIRGSNTTCRHHIRSIHFEEYKSRVEAATPKLELHHATIPKWYSNQLKKELDKEGEKQQTLLNFKPKQQVVSTKEGRLSAIAEFIVIENQVC
jgi:hypothetical protein